MIDDTEVYIATTISSPEGKFITLISNKQVQLRFAMQQKRSPSSEFRF